MKFSKKKPPAFHESRVSNKTNENKRWGLRSFFYNLPESGLGFLLGAVPERRHSKAPHHCSQNYP